MVVIVQSSGNSCKPAGLAVTVLLLQANVDYVLTVLGRLHPNQPIAYAVMKKIYRNDYVLHMLSVKPSEWNVCKIYLGAINFNQITWYKVRTTRYSPVLQKISYSLNPHDRFGSLGLRS